MPVPLRVLIAEDFPADVGLVLQELSRSGFVPVSRVVDCAEAMQAALADEHWDIVLSDYSMPGFGAEAAFALSRDADPDLPFVVISGSIGEERAVEMMRVGVSDYVLKGNLNRLGPIVERELREAGNRRARRAAEMSVVRLASIVECSHDAIISESPDGIVTSWNSAAERLFGWSATEAVGKHVSFLAPPDRIAEHAGILERLRQGKRFEQCETVRLHRDGTRRDVSITMSPITDSTGCWSGIAKIVRDITARKAADVALQVSEQRYRRLFEATHDGILIVDPVSRKTIDVNPFLTTLLGYDREELIGKELWQIGLFRDIEASKEAFRTLLEVGHVRYDNHPLQSKDGGPIEVEFVSNTYDVGGTLVIQCNIRDTTEHHRAQEALRASEGRYRKQSAILKSVLDSMGDGVIVADEQGKFLLFNPAAEQIVGLALFDSTPEEWSERYRLFLPDGVTPFPVAEVPLFKALRGEQSDDVEMIIDHEALPQPRWLSVTARPMRNEAGVPCGGVAVYRNITKRKCAEAALLASEHRYRTLVDASVAIIWDSPASGEFDSEQPKWTEFTGQTLEQHRGWGWLDAIHPEDREKSARAWSAAMAARDVYEIEHRVRRADGVYRLMSARAIPIFDRSEAIIEWVGIHSDVTDRRNAEEAVHRVQNRLQHVIASNPAVLFTLAVADNQIRGISWISDNVRSMLGYSAQDALLPEWWLQNIHPDDRDGIVAKTHAELFAQGLTSHEYRFRHRDGRYCWTRGDLRLMRDAAGNAVEVVGSWSDITERKQLEAQFRQAQKLEAFGQLAGGVAHDFNNLLTIINGYSDLLLQSLPPGDRSRSHVVEIHKAGERSAGLTRQLLAFSRQQVLAPRVLTLNEVVTDTDKMLRRLIGEDIRLTTTLDSEPWSVRADPGQIEQVLLNLAVNARDAMPQGGRLTIETGKVELDETYVRTRNDARAGPHVLLSVSDTGCGIPPKALAKIFEPFFTTKEPGKGTGLGLATVYGIVSQSSGHITVYTEAGVGTTFKVYLPQVQAAADSPKSLSKVPVPPRGTETVLLVEDEPGVRTLVKHVLSGCGYTVLEAEDGEEAMRSAAGWQGPIHLLITDVVMPGLGGRAVAEQLASRHPDLRVLFMSGYTDDAVIRHGVLREGMDFLQKPFGPVSLAFKVREVLDATAEAAPGE